MSVSAITNTWTGAVNNTWDINTTLNWSAPDQKYLEGDIVLFNDTGSNTNPVNLAANVNPASVAFNNSTKAYTISSTGGFGIAGSASLVKNGTGLVPSSRVTPTRAAPRSTPERWPSTPRRAWATPREP